MPDRFVGVEVHDDLARRAPDAAMEEEHRRRVAQQADSGQQCGHCGTALHHVTTGLQHLAFVRHLVFDRVEVSQLGWPDRRPVGIGMGIAGPFETCPSGERTGIKIPLAY